MTTPAFEPRTVTDVDGDSIYVNVFTRSGAITPGVRVELDQAVYLDSTGARRLGLALLDAADTLPLEDGWYVTYTNGAPTGTWRVYKGCAIGPLATSMSHRAHTVRIGPLTPADLDQLGSSQ